MSENKDKETAKTAVLKLARQFSSPEALKTYLKEHPKADPSKHSVGPKKKDKTEAKPAPKKEQQSPETKPKNDDLAPDVREKLKKLSPKKKKEVFQKAILNNETEGEKTKQKDVSKGEGFEALKGLNPAAQKKLLERALKMASTKFKKASIQQELALAASEFAKTALSGKDKARRTLLYVMESKPSSAEIILTDLVATNSNLRGIHYGKIEQAAKELEKEGRIKFDGVVMQSIPGAGQKIAIDLLKKVQSKFKSKHKHLSTDLDLHDDPDQATLNVWDDNDEPTYAGILSIVVDYIDGSIGIDMIYPGSSRMITLDDGNADRVFKEAEQFVKKIAPEFFTKAKEE